MLRATKVTQRRSASRGEGVGSSVRSNVRMMKRSFCATNDSQVRFVPVSFMMPWMIGLYEGRYDYVVDNSPDEHKPNQRFSHLVCCEALFRIRSKYRSWLCLDSHPSYPP